jgi:hypothetical protein
LFAPCLNTGFQVPASVNTQQFFDLRCSRLGSSGGLPPPESLLLAQCVNTWFQVPAGGTTQHFGTFVAVFLGALGGCLPNPPLLALCLNTGFQGSSKWEYSTFLESSLQFSWELGGAAAPRVPVVGTVLEHKFARFQRVEILNVFGTLVAVVPGAPPWPVAAAKLGFVVKMHF